jgi:pentatricopeptide repeat protein
MSFFCSFPPSTAGTLVSKIAHRQVLLFLYPSESTSKLTFVRSAYPTPTHMKMVSTSTPSLEQWFIKSLATAGLCNKHNTKSQAPNNPFTCRRSHLSARKDHLNPLAFRRQHSTQVVVKQSNYDNDEDYWDSQSTRTKEELLQLVDQYAGSSYAVELPLVELPILDQSQQIATSTTADKVEDEWPPPNYVRPTKSTHTTKLEELQSLVRNKDAEPDLIYEKYRELPGQRATYLEPKLRHEFLRRLYTMEKKDENSMLRYLSVIDDMKNAAIPLTTIEWNSAISFAARYVAKSTEVEVEAALYMWQEMEQVAGVAASDVTFNILFDVACKAGKFALAEMIYKEMGKRGIRYTRFHHVSLIHYYGLQRNGDGARAAYNQLVEAGEIVDTVVLNAMIAALISSYETNAAENTYERMKRMHNDQAVPRLPPKDYLTQRAITRSLKRMAIIGKDNPIVKESFQKRSIVAPDLHTYRILVNHYSVQAGELGKIATLLKEMKTYGLPVHGAMFLALFKGFTIHGGIRYSDWTSARLEKVWSAFLSILDGQQSDLYVSRWMVAWALRAFSKCSGEDRTLMAWKEIKTRWQPNEMETSFVMEHLKRLVKEKEASDRHDSWILGV